MSTGTGAGLPRKTAVPLQKSAKFTTRTSGLGDSIWAELADGDPISPTVASARPAATAASRLSTDLPTQSCSGMLLVTDRAQSSTRNGPCPAAPVGRFSTDQASPYAQPSGMRGPAAATDYVGTDHSGQPNRQNSLSERLNSRYPL